jgi:hypothetical protein
MLEVKTKGNLTKEEAALLKQALMNSRLAFVEAVEAPTPPAEPPPAASAPSSEGEKPAASEEESRKKFTKKY